MKFSDVKSGTYYYDAVIWALDKKILVGYQDGTFRPNGDCLRRQMATFLDKYDRYVNGN
ncbi:MAG: S-layer homology domain-containing protein [Clostridiales bacterium]|nr:S-layer homology domain-containing protein [Clostridiales bacterium]